jgi:hypothetical protein
MSLGVLFASIPRRPIQLRRLLPRRLPLKAKLCTVSGCATGTVINLSTITTAALASVTVANDPIQLTAQAITQTAGASAAFETSSDLAIGVTATNTAAVSKYADINTATVGTIDTTGALFLQITVAFSAASASNSVTQRQLLVEILN